MNDRQREYFRRKLVAWKEDILRESRETIQNLQTEPTPNADLADRATTEAERQLELRTRDRQRKLIAKIDSRAAASGGRLLWFLRGNRRADFAEAARCPPHCDAVRRSAGTSRTPRTRLSRRIIGQPRVSSRRASRSDAREGDPSAPRLRREKDLLVRGRAPDGFPFPSHLSALGRE